ncbi:MAG: AAA family ATPase [Pseudoclavibacter sp.]
MTARPRRMSRLDGRENQRLTRETIAVYGPYCWLRMPGCTRLATTRDHVVPFAHGGTDALANQRPACRHCNSRRQDRVISGYGATIHAVIGPPAAGKSTYVAEHAAPDDVVIDLDAIARALMPAQPEQTHTYPDYLRHVAIGARQEAMRRAVRLAEHATVWLIQALPTVDQLRDWAALHYDIITVDPGRAIVEQRASSQRPAHVARAIALWYQRYPTPAAVTAHTRRPAWAEQPTTDADVAAPSRKW